VEDLDSGDEDDAHAEQVKEKKVKAKKGKTSVPNDSQLVGPSYTTTVKAKEDTAQQAGRSTTATPIQLTEPPINIAPPFLAFCRDFVSQGLEPLYKNTNELEYVAEGFKTGKSVDVTKIIKTSYHLPNELGYPLAEGHFGSVYLVTSTAEGRKIIVKELKLSDKLKKNKGKKKEISEKLDELRKKKKLTGSEERNCKYFEEKLAKIKTKIKNLKLEMENELKPEMAALQRLNHKHVVKFYGYDILNGNRLIVTEYLPSLKKLGGGEFKPNVKRIAIAAAKGLDAVHKAGLLHNDFASRNIYITSPTMALVGDFGLAKLYDKNGFASYLPGSPSPQELLAPEMLMIQLAYGSKKISAEAYKKYFSLKTDIFAFGLFLCALQFNIHDAALEFMSKIELRAFVMAHFVSPGYLIVQMESILNVKKRKMKGTLRELTAKCLHPNPQMRPLVPEILKELKKLEDDDT
jgi:serine/threonine protein kinase